MAAAVVVNQEHGIMAAKSIAIILLAVLSFISIGCEKDIVERPIDSEILIEAKEENGSIFILAETVKLYPQSSYVIDFNTRTDEPVLIVRFKSIKYLGGGLDVIWPAKCEIELGTLEKSSYPIRFNLDGVSTEGILSTEPLKLEISETSKVKLK